jgi:hypothetical protein
VWTHDPERDHPDKCIAAGRARDKEIKAQKRIRSGDLSESLINNKQRCDLRLVLKDLELETKEEKLAAINDTLAKQEIPPIKEPIALTEGQANMVITALKAAVKVKRDEIDLTPDIEKGVGD